MTPWLLPLAVVTGISDILPISVAAHTLLVARAAAADPAMMADVEVMLQAGTVVSVLAVYARMLANAAVLRNVIIASAPTFVAVLVLSPWTHRWLSSPPIIGGLLIALGIAVAAAEARSNGEGKVTGPASLTTAGALFIGAVDALMMVPGTSHVLTAYGGGRLAGLGRKDALDFAFLMAIPNLGIPTFMNVSAGAVTGEMVVALGVVFAVGYVTLRVFRRMAGARAAWVGIGVYRVLAGAALLWLTASR
jgi:undecaprenyl pyrophosphate phosphatase UppP